MPGQCLSHIIIELYSFAKTYVKIINFFFAFQCTLCELSFLTCVLKCFFFLFFFSIRQYFNITSHFEIIPASS